MTLRIDPDQHAWFTQCSGDANPIHADPVASRRLLGGRMLVHGAHLLLLALDRATAAGAVTTTPERVHVLFRQAVAPGDELDLHVDTSGDGTVVRLTRAMGGNELAVVTITPGDPGLPPSSPADQDALRPDAPRPLDLEGLAGLVGAEQPTFRPPVDAAAFAARFPAATAVLGPGRIAEIAAISFVVGMLTPGRASMSSSYDITWAAPTDGAIEIGHTLDRFDARLRRAMLTVTGPSLRATVTAFSPPPPVDQRAVLADGPGPEPGEFAGWRALVVGASRGLGEAAARLLVAGGADVRITWARCQEDGERVAHELGVRARRWEAPGDDVATLTDDGWSPTHLCWFASPPAEDDPAAQAIEVDAFGRVLDALRGSLLAALWPSTDLLDELPEDRPPALAAVAARKQAGEAVCSAAGAHAARLPTLLTDRSQTLLPREHGDTARELLRALRATASTQLRAAPGGAGRGSDTVPRHE